MPRKGKCQGAFYNNQTFLSERYAAPAKLPPALLPSPSSTPKPAWLRWTIRLTLWLLGLATAGALSLALVIAVALAMAYPNLPDISDLADYRPKLPLRVYSAEGALLGEFGRSAAT